MFKTIPIIVMATLCLNFNIKAQSQKTLPLPSKQAIRGKIISATTGEALPGAVIKITTVNHTVVSTNKGEFIVTLSNGAYSLSVSHIGYKTKNLSIQIPQKEQLVITLETDDLSNKTKEEQLVQSKANIKPLKIGDTIPEALWNTPLQIVNHPEGKETITLNDYRGKLIILDFWATNCSSCVKALSKLELLQRKFKDSILILPVSYEKKQLALASYQNNNTLKLNKMGSVVEDFVLKTVFPHQYISHLVWIDAHGIVRAFTHTNYVTEENIKLLLKNSYINWPVKEDFVKFDYNKRLLVPNTANFPFQSIPKMIYYSTVTGNLTSIRNRYSEYRDTINKTLHVSMINYPIWQLYARALTGTMKSFPVSNIIVKTDRPDHYFFDPKTDYAQEWDLINSFCYQAVFPLSESENDWKVKMKYDLDYYFNLESGFKNVIVKCLVVSEIKDKQFLQKNSDEGNGLNLENIVYRLNQSMPSIPIINQTENGKYAIINISEDNVTNISLLKRELLKNGLDINEEQRSFKMLVLTEMSNVQNFK